MNYFDPTSPLNQQQTGQSESATTESKAGAQKCPKCSSFSKSRRWCMFHFPDGTHQGHDGGCVPCDNDDFHGSEQPEGESVEVPSKCQDCGMPNEHMNHDLPYGDMGTHAFKPASSQPAPAPTEKK